MFGNKTARRYSVLSNRQVYLNTEKEAKEVISIYIIILYIIDIEISLQNKREVGDMKKIVLITEY